jgi:hypothetical protein
MSKKKEKCSENAKENYKERIVFTDKSDLPEVEALFEIFEDFPETGRSST